LAVDIVQSEGSRESDWQLALEPIRGVENIFGPVVYVEMPIGKRNWRVIHKVY
jgi:hypothetical protein